MKALATLNAIFDDPRVKVALPFPAIAEAGHALSELAQLAEENQILREQLKATQSNEESATDH